MDIIENNNNNNNNNNNYQSSTDLTIPSMDDIKHEIANEQSTIPIPNTPFIAEFLLDDNKQLLSKEQLITKLNTYYHRNIFGLRHVLSQFYYDKNEAKSIHHKDRMSCLELLADKLMQHFSRYIPTAQLSNNFIIVNNNINRQQPYQLSILDKLHNNLVKVQYPSIDPNGYGLFSIANVIKGPNKNIKYNNLSTPSIPPGTPIVQYFGEIREGNKDQNPWPNSRYVFYNHRSKQWINAENQYDCLARYINYPTEKYTANACYRIIQGQVWACALRDIRKNEEILINYAQFN